MRALRPLLACAVVTLVSGTTFADSKPTKPPMCGSPDGQTRAFVVDGKGVVCWGDTGDCLQLGDKAADRKAVKHPAAKAAPSTGKAGKKLAAELKKPDLRVQASADGAFVSISGEHGVALWNVAKDATVKLTTPSSYKKDEADKPGVVSVDFVGNTIIASWSNCAGPCTRGQIVGADGKNIGKDFESGYSAAIDAKRIAIAGENGTLTILEASTAKVLGSVDTTLPMPDLAVLSSTELFLAGTQASYQDGASDYQTTHAKLDASGKPTLANRQAIPSCP